MISKNEKILITGASGLVGKNLINRLNSEGYEVLGLDSKTDLINERYQHQLNLVSDAPANKKTRAYF